MNAASRREIVLVLGIVCLIAAAALIPAGLRGGRRPTAVAVATATPAAARGTTTPAPTPRASATPTATPAASATPTARPSATPTARPSATPAATPTPTPRPSATATATPAPTQTPTAKPSATSTARPTATPTAKPTATPTARPSATPTPRPSPTQTQTPAPHQGPPQPSRAPATRAPERVATNTGGTQTYVGGRPNDACLRALTYITTAANERITRQAVYNAARAGLEENAHCAEPRRSVNEAYLYAMLAPAEFSLGRGDWRHDLEHSNQLLEACVKARSFAGTEIADDCAKQRSYNDTIRGIIERQPARRGS